MAPSLRSTVAPSLRSTVAPSLRSAVAPSLRVRGCTVFSGPRLHRLLGRDLLWPRPTLANSFSYFGHDLLWPRPTLATTYFGHDLLWPRPILATTDFGFTKFGQAAFFHNALTFQNVQTCRTEKNGKKETEKKNDKCGTINKVRVCVKASPT